MSKVKDRVVRVVEQVQGFNLTPYVISFLMGAAVMGGLGWWWYSNKVEEFERDVHAATERARDWELAWNKYANAYEERALQFLEADSVNAHLKGINEQLLENLEDRGAKVLALQETITSLRARLDSSRTTASQVNDTTYNIALDESVTLNGGGHITVRGDVELITVGPEVTTDLTVGGEFPLNIVLSRNEDNEIVVNAFTGDERLRVTQADVRWTAERPASGGVGGVFEALGEHFTSGSVWLGRLEGAGACILLNALN